MGKKTDFKEVTIKEIASPNKYSVIGGPFGSKLVRSDYIADGVPVLRGKNLPHNKKIDLSDLVFVSDDKVENDLFGNLAFAGDIIVTQRGTLGQVGIVPKNTGYNRFVISQSQMKLKVDPEKANSSYIYYLLKSPPLRKHIIDLGSSSGVPHINLKTFRDLKIPLPSLEIQNISANILNSFDTLIENNTRRIEILEESAKALYKEWFVHYRYPGHENDTMVDSELGPIPNKFTSGILQDLADRISKSCKPNELRKSMPILDLEHFPRGSITARDWTNSGSVTSSRHQFETGDILFGKLRPYFHKVIFASFAGACTPSAFIFRAKNPLHQMFILSIINSNYFVDYATTCSTGTTMPSAPLDVLMNFPVAIPTEELIRDFEKNVRPLVSQCVLLAASNRRLHTLRDLLLPRLISGELDVTDLDLVA